MARKVTTEEFIERAKTAHGDTYDYSESVYVGTHEKLRIICHKHGIFEQSPANHLKGKGCPECGKLKAGIARRSNGDAFIEKARVVHGDFYDYSQVDYKRSNVPVTIICPEHGPFEQTPNGHLSGRGCRKCAGNMPYTTESFVEAAKGVHGDTYDYSKVEYRGVHEKVCLVCPAHGEFWQEPVYHLKGGGCSTCSKVRGHKLHRDHAAEAAKREATMRERYGVAHALESDEFKAKAREMWAEHYGVDHPMKDDGVKQGYRDTMMERYGAEYPYQVEEIWGKAQNTWKEKYGADTPLGSDVVRAKAAQTWMEKYGVDNPLKSDEVRDKGKETLFHKHGVDNPMKSEVIRAKSHQTKRENGTFSTSTPEERLHSLLVDHFGESDVIRQFSDVRYPFACDFHIISLDLFIELNASWTHGGRWFDSEDDACLEQLRVWSVRSGNSEYYRNAIAVWTGADVRKRMQAQAMDLNYAVFWDNDLADAMEWFDEGCPLRKNWM